MHRPLTRLPLPLPLFLLLLLLQTGSSRFEGFKLGSGHTLVVRATLRLNTSGIYTVRVSAAGRQTPVCGALCA